MLTLSSSTDNYPTIYTHYHFSPLFKATVLSLKTHSQMLEVCGAMLEMI